MLAQSLIALLPLLAGLTDASPLPVGKAAKREVPQELSHDKFLRTTQQFLQLDNPDNIQDPVFGLLGNAAAAGGAGAITNLDCLQQETADRAFTNAKAQNSVEGMTAALVYRALERNTARVGLASVICNEASVNPEIGEQRLSQAESDAITQHQDPASTGAAATNKGITLELAKQLASIGADPLIALQSGTFTPGDVNDPTGAGNTCDDPDCIFEQGRLVEDATEAEITAAVSGIVPRQVNNGNGGGVGDTTECPAEEQDENGGNGGSVDGIDVGQCTDFSMTFAGGLQGRGANEFTFQPTDLVNFNHGNALNPNIIAIFMCDTFVNQCAKSATTRDLCKTVQSDLAAQLDDGTLQRDQGYADAWLSSLEAAFGFSSTGRGTAGNPTATQIAVDVGQNPTATQIAVEVDQAPTATQIAVDVPTATQIAVEVDPAPTATQNAVEVVPPPTQTVDAVAQVGSGNVQTFLGALNGVSAPAVTQGSGARPFSINGDTFVNKGAALQRSCAVQHNACANAFNSGNGQANVAACDDQEDECNAVAASA